MASSCSSAASVVALAALDVDSSPEKQTSTSTRHCQSSTTLTAASTAAAAAAGPPAPGTHADTSAFIRILVILKSFTTWGVSDIRPYAHLTFARMSYVLLLHGRMNARTAISGN